MERVLELDDIIAGLQELVQRARAADIRGAEIRIIGGAALRMLYFDRPATVDIDAYIEPRAELEVLSLQIARERNWPEDWLNDKARQFIPSWGRDVEWRLFYDDENLRIWVAPVEALLAMKLNALQGRPGRDADDVAKLLRLNEIVTVEAAEDHYEQFYPGDGFSARTIGVLEKIFALGLPHFPPVPQNLLPHPDASAARRQDGRGDR